MKKPAGFTLLEILVALSLFMVVIILVGSIYILAQQSYNRGSGQSELIQNARVFFDRLSRELRQAEFLVTDVSATSSDIFFQDGHDDDYITYIRYHREGTDLYRSQVAYYFPSWPVPADEYVYFNSLNEFGDHAASTTLEKKIIGEYFTNLAFRGEFGVLTITADLVKGSSRLNIDTKTYIRNW